MFKMVSDPITGGISGAIAGMILKKLASKVAKDSQIVGVLVPVAGGFLLKKKAPFFATGMIAGGAISFVSDMVSKQPANSMLHKLLGDDAHFVNDNLLSANQPILLSADGSEILPYQLKDMILQEMEEIEESDLSNAYYSGMSNEMQEMDED